MPSSDGVRSAVRHLQRRRPLAASDAGSRRLQSRDHAHGTADQWVMPSTGGVPARTLNGGGGNLQQAALRQHGRQLRQLQGSRRCESGPGCVIAFSLLLAAAVVFLCSALCFFCCW